MPGIHRVPCVGRADPGIPDPPTAVVSAHLPAAVVMLTLLLQWPDTYPPAAVVRLTLLLKWPEIYPPAVVVRFALLFLGFTRASTTWSFRVQVRLTFMV